MTILWLITGTALLASLATDRQKTRLALVKGLRMFLSILPVLLGVLALISFTLAALTPGMIERAFSGSGPLSFISALAIGSVALIPGFIAYPLVSIIKQQGASTAILAAFITSLMMVGVLTLPLEARFFGWRVSLERNSLAFIGSVVTAAIMSWVLT